MENTIKSRDRNSFILLFALFAVSGNSLAQNVVTTDASTHEKIHFFQHTLIPEWVHHSNGRFFADLANGEHEQLLEYARQVVSADFSAGITITSYPENYSLLISFPEPDEPSECYFIYVRKSLVSLTFSLYTYERTRDFANQGVVGLVGSWAADMEYVSQGPRSYNDAASFMADIEDGYSPLTRP